jgi:phosphoglycerate dehydrogenase-like enzyme
VALARITFAGPQFPATRHYLREVLPDHPIVVDDPGVAARGAEVLMALMARVDGEYMDRFAGLRLIHQWGAGLEGVDIAAATERSIAVGNVPASSGANAASVAEWCLLAALFLARRVTELQATIRSGTDWGVPVGEVLSGKTAGIVGLGGIGAELAPRLKSLNMRVCAVTQQPSPERERAHGLDGLWALDELYRLLEIADFVFLCLPVNTSTRGLIGTAELRTLSPSAIVINAGRGPLMDEEALIEALDNGWIAGAGLDVFHAEPLPVSSPLANHPKVFATPHVGGVTDVSYRGIAERVGDAVRRLDAGEPLDHCVNWNAVRDGFYRAGSA